MPEDIFMERKDCATAKWLWGIWRAGASFAMKRGDDVLCGTDGRMIFRKEQEAGCVVFVLKYMVEGCDKF